MRLTYINLIFLYGKNEDKKFVMKIMIITNTVLAILKMVNMAETLWKHFLGHQNIKQILFLASFNKKGENNNGRIIC